ncbi:MAG: two-component regulator propeller domain-containing protein [Woeseiaceae bacterium]|nr:two-component regulator propeller domain-containing protein [Woeseiaceae bacterium]
MKQIAKDSHSRLGDLVAVTAALLFALMLSASAHAAGSSHPMRFDHLTLDDGLSQSTVLAIRQDSSGYIWIGTENGLNRYNGYEFTHFKRERGNPDALSNDFILDIAEDDAGNLWLATSGGGLVRYDRESETFRTWRHDPQDPASIGSDTVRRVLVDKDGFVWAGTRGAGLSRLDPASGSFSHYRFKQGDHGRPDNIYVLMQDTRGFLWAGGDHGLTRLDTRNGDSLTFAHLEGDASSLSKHSVRAIEQDADGRIWVGTYGGGLHRLRDDGVSFDRFVSERDNPATLSSNRVAVIFEDSDGRLWAGTTKGLNLVDRYSGEVTRYVSDATDISSLSDDSITTIYEDRTGLLWIGTKTHGINKWNPRTWSYGFEPAREVTASGESKPNVTSFVEDAEGTVWIGTFGDGLNALNRDTGDLIKYRKGGGDASSIADDRVMSLMRDRNGKIWVGTMGSGISVLDPVTGKSETFRNDPADPESLGADGIMTIVEDSLGQVWVGTFGGGISRFDRASRTFTRFVHDTDDPTSISSNRVTSFAEDTSGRIWIGTESGGLNLFDAESSTFRRFMHDPNDPTTLAANTVYSINVDAKGVVWVGTHGGGLDKVVGEFDKDGGIRFENLSQTDGLANDVIYGVQFDETGRIWMSTNYGISRYHPETGEISNMHRRDGLQSDEFNFGAHYRSDSGELFFGGHNGYNAFHPEDLRANTVVPLIALTAAFNMGDPNKADLPFDKDDGIDVSWKDDVITFEFAALDYTASEMNRYQYKLEGFDQDWIDLGYRRRITYTDLDDGNYLLRVKAANSDGTWNEAGFALPVHVSAAPWDTWWAYTGYAILFAYLCISLWLGHKRKIQREEEYSHRLELEVNSRTERLLDKNQQLRELNKALQESSLSDPLTGLRNRRFVFEEVSRDLDVIRRKMEDEREGRDTDNAAEMVFMMIDLDNFKPINDTYGHAAGDAMLLELRDVLLGICRRSDFVIRWGGDEFVVIAKQAKHGEAEALAERIRSTICNHSFALNDGQIVRTTCSIGFAAYPLFKAQADDGSLDQVISLADALMYEAKRERNAWVGMLGPSEACTSADFDHESIEPTSVLFRARRAGNLARHASAFDGDYADVRTGTGD